MTEQVPMVRSMRQILLWPVQLIPHGEDAQIQKPWEFLEAMADRTPWQRVTDEFASSSARFSERRYREFVSFLPFAQRFLYGEAKRAGVESGYGNSPIFVFSRNDVKGAQAIFPDVTDDVHFDVNYADLYFFFDLDVAMLVVEIAAKDLPLPVVLETLYRFGRTYPGHWEDNGRGGHCPVKVEWLDAGGNLLSASDYEQKERYLNFVRDQRAPRMAAHWEFLMKPLVQHYSDQIGDIRYREIEYQRMPLMNYLAFDDVSRLTRGDLVRIGLVTRPGDSDCLPYSEEFLRNFESQYCYNRYWDPAAGSGWGKILFLCNGQSFTVIGNSDTQFFTDKDTGIISQFSHQYFLLFLIAHFQKAALLMLSDRLVLAISRLDINDNASLKAFRLSIRSTLAIFLRFTHRYWFDAVSDQAVSRDLFAMILRQLGSADLYQKTRRRILDMTEYLEGEQLKLQADTVVRLTVVTVFGLIGSITTGLLGMNLIDAASNPPLLKLLYFALAFVPVAAITLYTVSRSRRLSRFLDSLANDRLAGREKLRDMFGVKTDK